MDAWKQKNSAEVSPWRCVVTVDVRYLPRSILPHPPPARPLLRARCFCDELVQSGPFADKEYLEEKFQKFGTLKDVYLPTDGASGKPRGCVLLPPPCALPPPRAAPAAASLAPAR